MLSASVVCVIIAETYAMETNLLMPRPDITRGSETEWLEIIIHITLSHKGYHLGESRDIVMWV